MHRFRTSQGDVVLTCTNGVSSNHLPVTESGLNVLHEADDDTVIWLESTATAALTKY